MIQRHLGWSHALYPQTAASGALPDEQARTLRSALDALGAKRVLLFGANAGTGAAVRLALGPLARGFVNSETLFAGMPLDCDAVVLAVAPRHYAAVTQRLAAELDLGDRPVLTLFDAEPAAAPGAEAGHGRRVRPCHLEDMFVSHCGEVYPCCLASGDLARRIGHLSDPDILDRLRGFDIRPCRCEPWASNSVFRPAREGEEVRIRTLNLELSLFCNSRCAMCCVHAPEYTAAFRKPDYSLYPRIVALVERLQPGCIYLQGGELLVQDRFFELCAAIRQCSPGSQLALVTNGNVPLKTADRAVAAFDSLVVSLYGHTAQTYRIVTGLDVARAHRFCERAARTAREKLTLKYLTTPVNFHEAPLFVDWAVRLRPRHVQVVDADSQDYVRYARPRGGPGFDPRRDPLHDLFWERIFTRSIRDLERTARANRAFREEHGIGLTVCGGIFDRLGVDLGL
jgi:MoaA/NifB/PqqE/SkfB family radical SAM enzyme